MKKLFYLKRVWSHAYLEYVPGLKKAFPELDKVPEEKLVQRLYELGVEFFIEKELKKTKATIFLRLTFPIALLVYLLLVLSIPVVYLVTGSWNVNVWSSRCTIWIGNWFKLLGLL